MAGREAFARAGREELLHFYFRAAAGVSMGDAGGVLEWREVFQ